MVFNKSLMTLKNIRAGKDVNIEAPIEFEYDNTIRKIKCDSIKTNINGKPQGNGCTIEFNRDILSNILQ